MPTSDIYNAVLDELLRNVVRHGLVFAHANVLVGGALGLADAPERLRFVDAVDGLAEAEAAGNPVCWTGFCDPIRNQDVESQIGVARMAIHQYLDAGGRLILVSPCPRMAYPDVPGSSVLSDSYLFRSWAVGSEAGEVLREQWASDEYADRCGNLINLGPDALAFLDYLVFDRPNSERLDASIGTPREWEALEGLGVACRHETGYELLPPRGRLRQDLEDAISATDRPQQDFAPLVAKLFSLERNLRSLVRSRAVAKNGKKWKGPLVSEQTALEVLKRAQAETEVASFKALRDPLEWLSLGELLSICQSQAFGRLGMPDSFWRRLGDAVVPIRNRVSHMRLLRRDDLGTVTTWLTAVDRIPRE